MQKNNTFQDNYELIKKIGSGSFGDVYLSRDKHTNILMASKVEDYNNKKTKLQIEKKMYGILHDAHIDQIPRIYNFLKTRKYHIMNMELLGNSLDKLFEKYNKKFDLPTVLKLGIDMVDILKNIHNAGIIHRDIKPNNFMTGKSDSSKLYIMDLGLSKVYMKGGKHIKYSTDRSIVGTARYIGNNIHLGFEPSRRDDMESIGFLLVYFIKGILPWQGLKKDKKISQIDKIKEVKLCISPEKLCQNIPSCFKDYLVHVKSLNFYDKPDYEYLTNLFVNTAKKMNMIPNYCWLNNSPITSTTST